MRIAHKVELLRARAKPKLKLPAVLIFILKSTLKTPDTLRYRYCRSAWQCGAFRERVFSAASSPKGFRRSPSVGVNADGVSEWERLR